MAVKQLTDGRWFCYYRESGRIKREYFGRGPKGEYLAKQKDIEMKIKKINALKIELDKKRAELERIRKNLVIQDVLPNSKKAGLLNRPKVLKL